MRKNLLCVFCVVVCVVAFTLGSASAASGPGTAWNVFTLPNPVVTPNWRSYSPADCSSDPDSCAGDNRFWEEWNFNVFSSAIDGSFSALHSQGKYQGVMMLTPLGDTPEFWNNIQLMYHSAASHGVALEVVLFPKWKYGPEYCYLYNANAPSACPRASGSSTSVAYRQVTKMMRFVENLPGNCTGNAFKIPFAIWYGWDDFSPGYTVLRNFWASLPKTACNLQASYITWLDTGFSGASEVKRLQNYVEGLNQPYWVNTELYSTAQIQQYNTTYAPYQTIITGYWGANDTSSWAQGMCSNWNTASQPIRLGVWTMYDRDVSPVEQYRSNINGSMAVVGSICSY